jgi:hypothetical protein
MTCAEKMERKLVKDAKRKGIRVDIYRVDDGNITLRLWLNPDRYGENASMLVRLTHVLTSTGCAWSVDHEQLSSVIQ